MPKQCSQDRHNLMIQSQYVHMEMGGIEPPSRAVGHASLQCWVKRTPTYQLALLALSKPIIPVMRRGPHRSTAPAIVATGY